MVEFCNGSNLGKIKVNGFYRASLNVANEIAISINGEYENGSINIPIRSINDYKNNSDKLLQTVINVLHDHLKHLKNGLTIDVHLQWLLSLREKGIQHVKHLYSVIINNRLCSNYDIEVN